jgi:hypothetical protein
MPGVSTGLTITGSWVIGGFAATFDADTLNLLDDGKIAREGNR